MKEFNLFVKDETEKPYTKDLKLVKTTSGFDLLDKDGLAIIRASNLEADGEINIFINNSLFDEKYTVLGPRRLTARDSYCSILNFKIVKKTDENIMKLYLSGGNSNE